MAHHQLNGKQRHALTCYVQEYYAAAGISDAAFAVQASKALEFSVTANNVAGCRDILDIPATRTARQAVADGSLAARVSVLEREVQNLLDAFTVFKHGCRGDKT